MTAGAVSVPSIVPLRAPAPGQHKSIIDSNTKIEIKTGVNWKHLTTYAWFQTFNSLELDTPGASIFYTVNGLNPEPFQKHGPAAKATMKYSQPFRLPGGRKCVKAVAISK